MKKEIICTVCPMGCHIMAEGEGDTVTSIEGYTCNRGKEYALNEFAHPVRILTTTIKTDDEKVPLIPVRSQKPVPKEKLMDAMAVIRTVTAKKPVSLYDVMVENICDTGINIVACAELK